VTQVLVLNRGWAPIRVESLRDALIKLWLGKAQVVDEEYTLHDFQEWCDFSAGAENGYIGVGNQKFVLPQIIKLREYNRVHQKHVKLNRYNVLARDKNTCAYCGQQFPVRKLTLDHVIPRAQGGRDKWENLVAACQTCNGLKADRTPEQAGMRLRRKPYEPPTVAPLKGLRLSRVPKRWEDFVDMAYWKAEIGD